RAAQERAKQQEATQAEAATPETEASAQTPQTSGTSKPDEPPPDWVVDILEPETKPQTGPEQTYEPEELGHIMPWLSGPPEPGTEAPQSAQGTSKSKPKPGLPPWLSGMTVQETLQTSDAGAEAAEAEKGVPDDADLGIEGLQ